MPQLSEGRCCSWCLLNSADGSLHRQDDVVNEVAVEEPEGRYGGDGQHIRPSSPATLQTDGASQAAAFEQDRRALHCKVERRQPVSSVCGQRNDQIVNETRTNEN